MGTAVAVGSLMIAAYSAYEGHRQGQEAKDAAANAAVPPNIPKPADTGDMAGEMLAAQRMAQTAGGTILEKKKNPGMFADTINPRKNLLGL